MSQKRIIADFVTMFSCIAVALVFIWYALGLPAMDWAIPMNYQGDTLSLVYLYDVLGRGPGGVPAATGMPFGTQMYDAPTFDPLNTALIQMLEFLGGSFGAGYNLYYLATVVLVGGVTYAVGRALGLERKWAFALSLLFNVIPFHLQRIAHLFFTNYIPAALAGWLAIGVICSDDPEPISKRKWCLVALAAAICGCCGIYYAFFSCLFIGIAACHAYLRSGHARRPFGVATVAVAIIVVCVLASLSPSLGFIWEHGVNASVAHRSPAESEIHGLKLVQMLLPVRYHLLPAFADLRQTYNETAPLVAENSTATLGVAGGIGFLLLLVAPFLWRLRDRLPVAVTNAAPLAWFGFAFATIGGFGAIFAYLISPQMRGLNRISIFLAFISLLGLFALIQWLCRGRGMIVKATVFLAVVVFGVLDVTPARPMFVRKMPGFLKAYANDRQFAEDIEKTLPDGAMVFQLPYVAFPESGNVEKLGQYEHLAPVLLAKKQRWTFGAMKGRPEATWYSLTAGLGPKHLVEVLGKVGFRAIEINRKGYPDYGVEIEKDLATVGLRPDVVSVDDNMVLYRIPGAADADNAAFAVAPDGPQWWPVETSSDGNGLWSKGDAQVRLANVATNRTSCRLSIALSSLVARKVRLMDGDAMLGEIDLPAGASPGLMGAVQTLSADLKLTQKHVKQLRLTTDVPAQSPDTGDDRELGFFWHLPEALLCD